MTAPLPPGRLGLPYVGESIAIFSNPMRYGTTHHHRYGAHFSTRFLGKPMVVLLSAEGHKFVMLEQRKNFLWSGGYGMMGKEIFGDALFVLDDNPHDFQRKMMTPAFHGRELPGYLAHMNQVIDDHLSAWGRQGQRPFYSEARDVAFALSTSLLLGMDPTVDRQRFRQLLTTLIAGSASLTHSHLPWTSYGRSLRANQQLRPILRKIIADRRQTPSHDAMGLLIASRDEEGQGLSDNQLMAQAITLSFAGYDSTSATLTWLLLELLRHPDLYERTRAEIGDATADVPIMLDDLKQQPLLDALIKESLRFHPAAPVLMRGTRETCEFGGYTIPGGWLVLLLPAYTHRRADYFADPDRFDPARFMAPRDEDRQHPYAWIGFGGAPRNCIGAGIAQMEIKTFLMKLLRHYDLQLLPGQNLAPTFVPISRPKSPVTIAYQARH